MKIEVKNIESKAVRSEVECRIKQEYFEEGVRVKKKPRNKCKRLMKYLCLKILQRKHFN